MGLFGWLGKKTQATADGEVRAWRESWTRAVESLDPAALPPLAAALTRTPPIADDLEVEEEMLDALRHLLELQPELAAGRLPVLETSHRVVGADRCHFSAPVSMPDDPAQPTGRLLLTSSRAVFAGGSRTPALPWHATREVLQTGRDLVFVYRSAQEDDGYRFRCNSFTDALCGAAIARQLMRSRQGAQR